jgi:predicted ATPase
MAQHPFLKSIRPVNLLSFGPNTEEIELRPLNILIGPNGSGKSNLIEILGLLSNLPDKDPFSTVVQTGGALEWTWKGKNAGGKQPSLSVTTTAEELNLAIAVSRPLNAEQGAVFYCINLRERNGAFEVATERFHEIEEDEYPPFDDLGDFMRGGGTVSSGRSVLSMPAGGFDPLQYYPPRMSEFAGTIEQFAFYRDWVFGSASQIRDIQPAGFDSYRLAPDSVNLAQVLKAWRDRGDQAVFDRLLELLQKFYEPVKDVDTELLGTHLRLMVKEDGLGSRTPASRLSDGTLRWLTLLIILLDPTPPPVICIDEPELGLHPDIIPTLADLLRDASTRTQLILTTHSTALVDAFSDEPESVCVCEKVDGSTVIKRLDKERLNVWLKDYSLGHLWASGEIGGNRW